VPCWWLYSVSHSRIRRLVDGGQDGLEDRFVEAVSWESGTHGAEPDARILETAREIATQGILWDRRDTEERACADEVLEAISAPEGLTDWLEAEPLSLNGLSFDVVQEILLRAEKCGGKPKVIPLFLTGRGLGSPEATPNCPCRHLALGPDDAAAGLAELAPALEPEMPWTDPGLRGLVHVELVRPLEKVSESRALLAIADSLPSRRESVDEAVRGAQAEPAEAELGRGGWLRCPNCGWRFTIRDRNAWRDGAHLRCGQRIRLTRRLRGPRPWWRFWGRAEPS